jgi:hypothetical protein
LAYGSEGARCHSRLSWGHLFALGSRMCMSGTRMVCVDYMTAACASLERHAVPLLALCARVARTGSFSAFSACLGLQCLNPDERIDVRTHICVGGFNYTVVLGVNHRMSQPELKWIFVPSPAKITVTVFDLVSPCTCCLVPWDLLLRMYRCG